jgi:hypothetical protein
VGSLHCAGMCGPLVLALAKARPHTPRASASRLFHHLGRIASYGALGLLFGLLGRAVALSGFQRWLSIALGLALLAGVTFSLKARLTAPVFQWVGLWKHSMSGLLQRDSLFASALLGALNGLLPCGLVYVAATGAASTGHPLNGAAYMALFGLGTWPMMLGIHFAGQRLPLLPRLPLGTITRVAVLLMAVLLILRGLELGIPLLSPHLSAAGGNAAHCH